MRLLTTTLLILACAACSGGSPEATVETFLSRADAGKLHAAKACLVEAERGTVTLTQQKCDGGWSVEKATIRGDRAEVRVSFDDPERAMNTPFVLRREGGDWRLSMTETILTAQGASAEALKQSAQDMTHDVGEAIRSLGDDPDPKDVARVMQEAMRRRMNAQPR